MRRGAVKAVLFDYGFTLVSYSFPGEALVAAMEGVRPLLGERPPEARWIVEEVLKPLDVKLPEIGRSRDEVDYLEFYAEGWRRVGYELPRSTLYRILDVENRCWDGAARVAPEAFETLEELRRRGVRTGICSNAPFPPEMMHRQLRVVGFAERVDGVVLSAEVGRRKPAAEMYLVALERVGVGAGEALFVGDQVEEDYEGPRAVGMRAVLCTGLARRGAPVGVPAVARLGEVLGWV